MPCVGQRGRPEQLCHIPLPVSSALALWARGQSPAGVLFNRKKGKRAAPHSHREQSERLGLPPAPAALRGTHLRRHGRGQSCHLSLDRRCSVLRPMHLFEKICQSSRGKRIRFGGARATGGELKRREGPRHPRVRGNRDHSSGCHAQRMSTKLRADPKSLKSVRI